MPARLTVIARNAARFGCTLDKPRKGSHWRFYLPSGLMYPVPAHNGPRTEIPDVYIRSLAGLLGTTADELKK